MLFRAAISGKQKCNVHQIAFDLSFARFSEHDGPAWERELKSLD
jgi:hypothetical protein